MTALMLLAAYLLGTIPTALIAGRIASGIDIRTRGSGNAGATNAARVLGPGAGLVVAVVDLAKGLVAVLIVSRIAPVGDGVAPVLCGIAAMLGHIFPVFAGFRGGKGVATAAGAAVALLPTLAPLCLLVFVAVAVATRLISVASLSAALALPTLYLASSLFGSPVDPWRAGFAAAVFVIVVFTHRSNIGRLLRGEEEGFVIKRRFRS